MITDKTYVRLSPQGKYVVWYEPADSSYYAKSTDVNVLDVVPLTKMVPISFFDEKNDKPMDSAPYGIAGWSQDDRFVYIYDRYDIWKIDPSGGRVPVCITKHLDGEIQHDFGMYSWIVSCSISRRTSRFC